MKSRHQMSVESFMLRAKQEVPVCPTEPSEKVRILRAKLMLEEVLETIRDGLGIDIGVWNPNEAGKGEPSSTRGYIVGFEFDQFRYYPNRDFNMIQTIDGCCDVSVVNTGTLSACGIPDLPFQAEVDDNNLSKFKPGHTLREDGKLIKPPNHQPPNIERILDQYRK